MAMAAVPPWGLAKHGISMIGTIGELFAHEKWSSLLDSKASKLVTALGMRAI